MDPKQLIVLEDLTVELLEQACERVVWNAGGAGVDGVTVERFAGQAPTALPELRAQAIDGSYFALPLRLIEVEKKPGSKETRKLLVPCVRDRVLQTAAARLLGRAFEEEFLEVSYAYRRGQRGGANPATAGPRVVRRSGRRYQRLFRRNFAQNPGARTATGYVHRPSHAGTAAAMDSCGRLGRAGRDCFAPGHCPRLSAFAAAGELLPDAVGQGAGRR